LYHEGAFGRPFLSHTPDFVEGGIQATTFLKLMMRILAETRKLHGKWSIGGAGILIRKAPKLKPQSRAYLLDEAAEIIGSSTAKSTLSMPGRVKPWRPNQVPGLERVGIFSNDDEGWESIKEYAVAMF
jgi:hypothetical protein